jgi:hypothetical protein
MALRQELVPVFTHRSESIQIDYRTRQEAP